MTAKVPRTPADDARAEGRVVAMVVTHHFAPGWRLLVRAPEPGERPDPPDDHRCRICARPEEHPTHA